jgi:hypothetical protein
MNERSRQNLARQRLFDLNLASMLPSSMSITALRILQPLLSLFYNYEYNVHSTTVPKTTTLDFELRHLHAVSTGGGVVFSDVSSTSDIFTNTYSINARPLKSYRPPSFEAFSSARMRSIEYRQTTPLEWDEDDIIGPDVEDRETLLRLAKMSNNAYYPPDDNEWYDLGEKWTRVRLLSHVRAKFPKSQMNPFALLFRSIRSVGNLTQTVSGAMYSPRRTTLLSSCPSKAPLPDCLALEILQPPRKTN